jgi:hypothetical protein
MDGWLPFQPSIHDFSSKNWHTPKSRFAFGTYFILYTEVIFMWRRLGVFLHKLWNQIFKRSLRKDTLLDTAQLKLFGMEITVTRELPINIPYELTLVVPRAEYRIGSHCSPPSQDDLEILLNSITLTHSPRPERCHSEIPKGQTQDQNHRPAVNQP